MRAAVAVRAFGLRPDDAAVVRDALEHVALKRDRRQFPLVGELQVLVHLNNPRTHRVDSVNGVVRGCGRGGMPGAHVAANTASHTQHDAQAHHPREPRHSSHRQLIRPPATHVVEEERHDTDDDVEADQEHDRVIRGEKRTGGSRLSLSCQQAATR